MPTLRFPSFGNNFGMHTLWRSWRPAIQHSSMNDCQGKPHPQLFPYHREIRCRLDEHDIWILTDLWILARLTPSITRWSTLMLTKISSDDPELLLRRIREETDQGIPNDIFFQWTYSLCVSMEFLCQIDKPCPGRLKTSLAAPPSNRPNPKPQWSA